MNTKLGGLNIGFCTFPLTWLHKKGRLEKNGYGNIYIRIKNVCLEYHGVVLLQL